MNLTPSCGCELIFERGRLKPGIYRIQNLYAQTYLDVHEHSREVCCRPSEKLEKGRGLWEIKSFGAGHLVQRVDPGRPKQYCAPSDVIGNGTVLHVGAYPVAWRIEAAREYHGYGYARFFWGGTETSWDLMGGSKSDGAKVQSYRGWVDRSWRIWKLIPVRVEGVDPPSLKFETPRSKPESST